MATAPLVHGRRGGALANRIQLTWTATKPISDAVEGAFGADVDYAMLDKIYGASSEGAKGRYSPAECIGAERPDRRQARYGARQHVLRRARKPDDADAQPPLHPADECLLQEIREPRAHGRDLCRLVQLDPHSQDLACTPAMAAGLCETVMDWSDIVEAMDADAPAKSAAPTKRQPQKFQTETLPTYSIA